jgi:hypothetical protein
MSTEDFYRTASPRGGRKTRPGVRVANTANSTRQRKAAKQLSECELALGMTPEQVREFHQEQRRHILAKYGVASA